MAASIVYNAKVRRPTICNALDTVLVHGDIAARALPLIAQELAKAGVEMHCDPAALAHAAAWASRPSRRLGQGVPGS